MKDSDVRIALAGCGVVVAKYMTSYLGIAGSRIIATVDADRQQAELGASQASADLAAVLEEDAVVVSTPNHLQQSTPALRADKHVLLQKPMAPTVRDGDAILQAHDHSEMQLGMYMNLLEHPLFHDLRSLKGPARTGPN